METVIVYKDKKTREIRTFVHLEGHGARMSVQDFVSLVAELYGSPATTMTKKTFLSRLLTASDSAIYKMKAQTKEVAAVNLEPPINGQK